MSKLVSNPEAHFAEMTPERGALMKELEIEAAREGIPIVGPVVGELLYILTVSTGAQRILELGTATGYSAIYLAEACRQSNGKVVTWEIDPGMAARARKNAEKAGVGKLVDVRVGDALSAIKASVGTFDLIFIDIEKSDYARALPDLSRIIAKGGLLLADNVAFKDAERFNRLIQGDKKWRSVSLFSYLPGHSPENDGLCIALRG